MWFKKKKEPEKDATEITVTDETATGTLGNKYTIYVKASTSEKALDLFDKLSERRNKTYTDTNGP